MRVIKDWTRNVNLTKGGYGPGRITTIKLGPTYLFIRVKLSLVGLFLSILSTQDKNGRGVDSICCWA